MNFLDQKIEEYVQNHTTEEPELLRQLNRETYAKILMPRMLSGHLQGRVLSMFSHMIRPNRILEIGTYTGYSAICLAEGLQAKGLLHTIDVNEELESLAMKYFKLAGMENRIKLHIGNAMDIIPQLNEKFDLAFIDADKENYVNYYDLIFDKVNPGGYILADNVLWSGKVLEDNLKKDEDTQVIIDFNRKIHHDERIAHVLFPIRDGLMVIRKR